MDSHIFSQFRSSPNGLTSDDARERLKQYGFNEPTTAKRASLLVRFLSFFANPLALILLLAAIVTQNFGSMDVLCSDKTGTLTSGEMTLDDHVDPFGNRSPRVFLFAYLNSLHETGVKDPTDAAVLHRANINPLDTAILAHDHQARPKAFCRFA